MEKKERVLNMANTIWNSLFFSLKTAEIMSWGISKRIATIYNRMMALELNVNGLIHKGSVIICYDEGSDTFIIYLLNKQRKVVKEIKDVYVDEVGRIIDENIERPKDMKDEEYRLKSLADVASA